VPGFVEGRGEHGEEGGDADLIFKGKVHRGAASAGVLSALSAVNRRYFFGGDC